MIFFLDDYSQRASLHLSIQRETLVGNSCSLYSSVHSDTYPLLSAHLRSSPSPSSEERKQSSKEIKTPNQIPDSCIPPVLRGSGPCLSLSLSPDPVLSSGSWWPENACRGLTPLPWNAQKEPWQIFYHGAQGRSSRVGLRSPSQSAHFTSQTPGVSPAPTVTTQVPCVPGKVWYALRPAGGLGLDCCDCTPL